MTITIVPGASWLPPRTYDLRLSSCPSCGVTDLGVREINPKLRVIAAHTEGRRRVIKQGERCAASELRVDLEVV